MAAAHMDRHSPVFAIAAAAELAQMHPQTLRQYDRIGLVVPKRTRGNTRRYSLANVQRLREVQRLSQEGLSLEGIRRVLSLEDRVEELEERVHTLEQALAEERMKIPGRRVFAAGTAGEVITRRRGTRVRRSAEVGLWQPGSGRQGNG